MTTDMDALSERDEIEMLVPWYVTGRISADDARRVEAFLRKNPDFAEHIELARDERAAAISVAEAQGFPSARATDRLFDTIAAEPKLARFVTQEKAKGLLAGIRELFVNPSPMGVRYAAIAAAAVVLAQSAVVGTVLLNRDDGGGFKTAAGPSETAVLTALVGFNDGILLSEIAAALDKAGARLADGPLKGGLYKVRFTQADEAQARAAMDSLKGDTRVVRLVLPSR
ncbi:MAG: hypothetical protein AB7E80_13435 [Hyphomicrobiaceae bacterium]